ncbi:MAG: sialidase family protein [Verrucomicrobiota bacterium]
MSLRSLLFLGLLSIPGAVVLPSAAAAEEGVIQSEFVVEQPPLPASHSPTIVETRDGILLAAWIGGSQNRALDAGVWMARYESNQWSAPVEVLQGFGENGLRRFPCWNPVLFQPKFGPLLLFYKVGPTPEGWWGLVTTSDNQGVSWSASKQLPKNYWGPIRNKPVELPEAILLCGSSTEDAGWRVHMEWMRSPGRDFGRTASLNTARELAAIQPTILLHRLDRIQILCRTKQGRIVESWSKDRGRTWSPLQRTELPNPNSAIDAVLLRDGRSLLVYNHSTDDRGYLNVALSADGSAWEAAAVLESRPGDEYSYPAVIQTRDQLVHIVYSWKRERIKHVVLDPARLRPRPIVDGEWPR